VERNLFVLILFLNSVVGSDIFWFSYRSVTSNKTLIYEEKNISPLTNPYIGNISSTCRVKISRQKNSSTLDILNQNFYKILPCFYSGKARVLSQTKSSIYSLKDEVELKIEPVRFIVDFKDDFANITILK